MSKENRKLTEPMREAQSELVNLRKKLENFDRDRAALVRTKSRFTVTHKHLNELKWEAEALAMRCEKLTEERDQLKLKFEEAVLELQQKTGLKNVLLERKLAILERESEKREVVLGEVLTAAGMEPHNLSQKMEKLLKVKNDKIQGLRYELARVCKAHNDLLATYEAKLAQFGIPTEELGFEPVRVSMALKLGAGPAGLVAKQKL